MTQGLILKKKKKKKKRRTIGREFLQSKTLGKSQRNKRQALTKQT